ncbi:hypothetical protein Ccrd_006540 [Cynara cardunculus var. scolymus]|uniref:Tetratricopeptide-like helical n=1 Tax=Cynara cardunculus var. scolymus TaxID=59895 RepID=A0A103XIL1_CYNCS|nr:hypothetical protein Ccrd_006540 [Cynara cardunculus var. scolymus]
MSNLIPILVFSPTSSLPTHLSPPSSPFGRQFSSLPSPARRTSSLPSPARHTSPLNNGRKRIFIAKIIGSQLQLSTIQIPKTSGNPLPLRKKRRQTLEFRLSQIYQEGLLKLQAKDYEKARELLESVLKDHLLPNGQVDNSGSDGHLLQLSV